MGKAVASVFVPPSEPITSQDAETVCVRLLSARETWGNASQIRVRVELEANGQPLCSEVEETGSQAVALRAAACATLAALQQAISTEMELVGVKRIRVFDANLVIVAVRERSSACSIRIGSAPVHDSPARAAALAVMDAMPCS